jgi:hypothetical protein
MKTPSQDLFDLIHSLQGTEIRGFRQGLRHQDSQTVRLFEALLTAAAYDESQLRREVVPELSANQFAVAKHYLYQAILLFLLQRAQLKPATWRIRTRLQLVELLYQRELFAQCAHQLGRIARAARQLDDPSLVQEVLLWQLRLADRQNHMVPEADFTALSAEFLACADANHTLARQQWHAHDFFFRLRKKGVLRPGEAIKTDFEALLTQAAADLPAAHTSLAARLTLLYAQATFAFMQGAADRAYDGHAAIIAAMEASPGWISSRPDMYLDSCFRVGLLAMEACRFEEASTQLVKIVALQQRHDLPAGRMFFYQTQLERLLVLLVGDWREIPGMVTRFDLAFTQVERRLSPSESATYQFNNAAALLACGECAAAQQRLLALLHTPIVKENVDFDIVSKLLLVLIAEQTRDAGLFQPWYRSLYRQLHAGTNLSLEKIILKTLRRAFSAKTQAKKAAVWLELENALLAASPEDGRAIQYFDFVSWVRSKTQVRSMEALVQERVKAHAVALHQADPA